MMDLKQRCSMKKLMLQKELTFIKQIHQKNVCFVITGVLKMLNLNLNHIFFNECSIGCIFSKTKLIEILNVKGVDKDVFYVVLAEIKLLIFLIILCQKIKVLLFYIILCQKMKGVL